MFNKFISSFCIKYGKAPATFEDMYKFGKVIGRGSDGTVSIAMHKMTGKLVAIK